jgi:predicted amidohydrolase YtcJ
MLADLAVLDRDPLTCPPEELRDIRVLATMVGGSFTYVSDDPISGICDSS